MSVIVELKDKILGLSLLEASALVKQLEEELGISAMAMALPQAGAAAVGGAVVDSAEEEKAEYGLAITKIDMAKKVQAIKMVRQHLGLGLKESKDFVESTEFPRPFGEKAYPKEEATKLKSELSEAGIAVSLE